MTKFDPLFRNLAVQLVDNTFGTSATLVQETASYDPVTGDNTKSTTSTTVSISPPVALSTAQRKSLSTRMADGSAFEQSDLICTMAAKTSPEPDSINTKLVWRGTTYQIVLVDPIISGDQDAAYNMVIRA